MGILIIPAIDIIDGKCVKKFEGLFETTEYYSESPINTVKLLRKENFKTIHITDLDGAVRGDMRNYEVIKQITKCIDIPIQLGGGIRDYDTAKKVIEELGVYRIVIGTAAIANPKLIKDLIKDFGPSKIIIGIDENNDKVMMDGWINSFPCTILDFAQLMKDFGVKRIIYQDIGRVGSLKGPNLERLKEIGDKVKVKLTSAGGIRDFRDLKSLQGLEGFGVDSVVVSRALYENKFPCQNIWREVERVDTSLDLPSVC